MQCNTIAFNLLKCLTQLSSDFLTDFISFLERLVYFFFVISANARSDNKLAVMLWLFGGAYSDGHGDDDNQGPDFLVEQDVILVSINYRVGVFGFLSLDTVEYSGNMGLKDQQLAIKWVHENIEAFYGDNRRFTVFGDSAGGASTHFQVLSNESRKYINNVIVMSGNADAIWSTYEENNHVSFAYEFAKSLGKPKNSTEELIEFFKTINSNHIRNTSMLNSTTRHEFCS